MSKTGYEKIIVELREYNKSLKEAMAQECPEEYGLEEIYCHGGSNKKHCAKCWKQALEKEYEL